jgi:phosphoribosylformylglycinamidine (FGAM) synthase PurS component
MDKFEQLKQQLRDLGFEEEKLNQLLDLAVEEVIDYALNELKLDENAQALEELSNEMTEDINSIEGAKANIDLIFTKLYKEEAVNKKFELLNAYLEETIELTKNAKDLMQRYAAGDPTAIATVQANINDPEAKAIQDKLDNE